MRADNQGSLARHRTLPFPSRVCVCLGLRLRLRPGVLAPGPRLYKKDRPSIITFGYSWSYEVKELERPNLCHLRTFSVTVKERSISLAAQAARITHKIGRETSRERGGKHVQIQLV